MPHSPPSLRSRVGVVPGALLLALAGTRCAIASIVPTCARTSPPAPARSRPPRAARVLDLEPAPRRVEVEPARGRTRPARSPPPASSHSRVPAGPESCKLFVKVYRGGRGAAPGVARNWPVEEQVGQSGGQFLHGLQWPSATFLAAAPNTSAASTRLTGLARGVHKSRSPPAAMAASPEERQPTDGASARTKVLKRHLARISGTPGGQVPEHEPGPHTERTPRTRRRASRGDPRSSWRQASDRHQ